METKGLTRAQLRGKLAEHCITQKRFAEVAQINPNVLSIVLRGGPVTSSQRARMERAIRELRLTEPAEDGTERVLFRVTQL